MALAQEGFQPGVQLLLQVFSSAPWTGELSLDTLGNWDTTQEA